MQNITRYITLYAILTLNVLNAQYVINSVSYAAEPMTGTFVLLSDDEIANNIDMGMAFCYWGNTYTRCYIGSNGWVGWSAGQPTAFTPFPIPINNIFTPKNAAFCPFQDLNTGVAGFPATPLTYVSYYTTGVAPFRRFVVSWNNVPMYQCTAIRSTQQVVLYETTNVIRMNIVKKSNCVAWVNGRATQGLHNINGTAAVTVVGRNATLWNILPTGESWTFTPTFCCEVYDCEIEIN